MPELLTEAVVTWYDATARDLPWRSPGVTPWAVMVSEFMLQQTPVSRVLGPYAAWLERWPTPACLAAEAPGEAVRMWGRLGYPRRALRLRGAAVAITSRHDGAVPSEVDALLALPGVGAYTAFAFGQRVPVVDTNVRRVVARAVTGQGEAGPPSTTRDLATVEALLPDVPARAARLSAALMELGAVVCTARAPRCDGCPVFDQCAWQLAGRPAYDGPVTRTQKFEGTDRQVRGKIMAVVRDAAGPVQRRRIDTVWHDGAQRDRCLHALVQDGLLEVVEDDLFALPG
jgi:A/G-specific adenine glycosylase